MRLSRTAFAIGAAITTLSVGAIPAFAGTVTVQPGQTLWKISQAKHVSLTSLEAANPSVNPLDLLIGTVLQVPTAASESTLTKAKTTTQTPSQSSIAGQNLYWMEHAINAEAGAESLKAQEAVGDVIVHRMDAGGYGETVRDVVFQISNGHYQFTSVQNGYIYTAPSATSVQAAKDVLQQHDDVVPGAFVFYNPAYTPSSSWVRSQPAVTTIGDLVFAK